MNEEKKKAIVAKLVSIAENATEGPNFLTASAPKMLILGSICLAGEVMKEFRNVCKLLREDKGWSQQPTENYVETAVIRLLGKMFKDGDTDKTSEYLDELIAEYEGSAKEHTIYLQVDGITMTVEEVKLGQITLKNMQGQPYEDFVRQMEAQITESEMPQEEKEVTLETWRKDGFLFLKEKVVATYTHVGEESKIQELAEKEWYKVAELLRYFVFRTYPKKLDIAIGLSGDVRRGRRSGLTVAAGAITYTIVESYVNPRHLLIDQEIYDAMEQSGIFELAELLAPEKETAFSRVLFRGIHWIADALTQTDPTNEYLSLTSCLETFLSREKTDLASISNALACGLGWVLGRDPDDRLSLHEEVKGSKAKKIKGLYNIRSTISHGEDPGDIRKDLIRLRDLVAAFVEEMIKRRDDFAVGGRDALHDWIDQGPMRPAS